MKKNVFSGWSISVPVWLVNDSMSLQRRLTLGDALLLIIGDVIGAGIFTTSGFLAGELPHPWLFLGIWLFGGLLTICGALSYAELAGMFPLAGGDYQYLKEAYGRWAGFMLGWVLFWVINPGSIAALAIGLVSYLALFVPGLGAVEAKLLAVAIILVFSWINYRGLRLSGTITFWRRLSVDRGADWLGQPPHFPARHFNCLQWFALLSLASVESSERGTRGGLSGCLISACCSSGPALSLS